MTSALEKGIDQAVSGDRRALFDLLTRGSNLPGARPNAPLADSFADAIRARAPRADALALAMARLDADSAPGATALEFLPMCGVLAIGARAASDPKAFDSMLAALHDAADDLRFRVRDAVVTSLARIGERRKEGLVDAVASWMDGYFHAAAVLRAMSDEAWLSALASPEGAIARMDEAFVLAREAPRAAARYPGFKSLLETLATTPRATAARFGVPVFDMLVRWTETKDPVLREIVAKNLGGTRLQGRHAPEIDRVRRALEATTPPARNPDHYFGPTRGRGKKRRG
jgi:hypothetical protein